MIQEKPSVFRCRPTTVKGFTLVELLVALFVFAILSVTAFRGLNGITNTRAHLDQETRKWQQLDRFFARLDGELAQVLPRPVYTPSGAEAPALSGMQSSAASIEDTQLSFTRNGGFDQDGSPLPPQRVGYRLREERLELLRWPALDNAPYAVPTVDTVVDSVGEFKVRYLTAALGWVDRWPLKARDSALPKGLEVTLILNDGATITRFLSLQ
jgi:general secretion pathway protein J